MNELIEKGIRELAERRRHKSENRHQTQLKEPPDAEQLMLDEMTRRSFEFLRRARSGR